MHVVKQLTLRGLPFVAPGSDVCVSTGSSDDLDKPENIELKNMLTGLNVESIKLPPGMSCEEMLVLML